MRALVTVVVVFTLFAAANRRSSCIAERILAVFPYPIKSHFVIFDALLTELAKRGHDVTMVTAFPKLASEVNYTQIDVSHCLRIPIENYSMKYKIAHGSAFYLLGKIKHNLLLFDKLLRCETMQRLKHPRNNYDLLITELFMSDALLAYAHVYRTPFILLNTLPMLPWHSNRVANIDNPSYLPFPLTDYSFDAERPTFSERFYNAFVYTVCNLLDYFVWVPHTDYVVRKHFGESVPSVAEIAKNVSLIFTYSHFSNNRAKPLVPAVIEVGGLNILDALPLPQDVDKFINESTHGVIYFCLGSVIDSKTMPERERNAFMNAFSKLPQRVLWKWENETIPGKVDNIAIKSWMPQRDILAHPKVKLFITHGGSLGLNEAIYEGVPVLGIPFYGDQVLNMKSIRSAGAGEILRYSDITEETLLAKINVILSDKRYAGNMKRLSIIYKDRPLTSMNTAIYWTEYVIRHKGAHHLRTAAVDLPLYRYLLLDVVVFTSTIVIAVLYLVWRISKAFIRLGKSLLFVKKQKRKKNL